MSVEKLGERVAVVEQISKSHNARLTKLEESNEALIKLSTLMEIQIDMDKQQNDKMAEMSRQQNEQMEKFGEVLDSVNINLTHLNQTSEQLKSSVGDLSGRISSIEATQDSHKIDVPQLMKRIFIGVAMISVALLSNWLMKVTGLK